MGERQGLNPRVVDSQSTALIHLATSAPTPALGKLCFKQRGWAVHFIDLTELDLRLKIGAGRAVKARLVDSKLRFLKRAPISQRKPLHASLLYRVPCAPLNYKLALKPLLYRWLGY
ncbi:hypothetical protein P8452_05033 [Trifolium repens]|nr:hypothetical protein P8452_05033 [Trifolium repens]